MRVEPPRITTDRFDAVLFDLDGVLTSTATLHAACWKKTFDAYLHDRAQRSGDPFWAFDMDSDYRRYVDGKPRYDGARSFLESRGIELPYGGPESPPTEESVCGLGNRKSEMFNEALRSEGVEVFNGAVAFVRRVRRSGIKTALVTSSKNADAVLRAAKIANLFDARVDGNVADRFGLRGKPAPDTFLKAAEMLGVRPRRAVVVEDAVAGVQAGRAGGFGLVVGVDRTGDAESLRENGADVVVSDLSALTEDGGAE